MLSWIREKFGTVVISGIIALLSAVFVFYGVLAPKSTRGLHDSAVAGTVNGDSISIPEFNKALDQRLQMFKAMTGGKIGEEQMRSLRSSQAQAVFRELVQRKILSQEAYRQNLSASDEEVRDEIQRIPQFQKDGHFDLLTYKQLLQANGYSAGSFERMVRDDLSARAWQQYFQRRALVSDQEARRDFLTDHDKRMIKYVLLTSETAARKINVTPEEIQKYVADPAKLNIVKSQFEARKTTAFKGKTFDQAKTDIARELLASDHAAEIQKINDLLAGQVQPLLASGKQGDARVNALLKPYGTEVKSTGLLSRQNTFVPGLGEVRELFNDAFSPGSPIDPSQGGKAKRYPTPGGGVVVALVEESQKPELAQFDGQREEIVRKLSERRERELMESWMDGLMKKARIDSNPAVLRQGGEEG